MFRRINFSKKIAALTAFFASIVSVFANSLPAGALSLMDVINGSFRGEGQPTELFGSNTAIIPRAINLMLFAVGVIAIFMLIWGGLRYVLSGGDSGKVKDAKNTILYAIVGLVVALLGYAIVNWVIQVVGAGAASSSMSV